MSKSLSGPLLAIGLIWSAPAVAENGIFASNPAPVQVERFGDWSLRCTPQLGEDQNPSRRCEVVQIATIKRADSVTPIVTLAIAADRIQTSKSKPISFSLTVLVPLNVFLPAGLSLQVNDKNTLKMNYRNCNQTGCWLQASAPPTTISRLMKGKTGSATIQLLNGQKVTIRFSSFFA